MGVYIKGMEMPKCCFDCDLYNDENNSCKAQKEYMPFALFGRDYKGENCPLVEVPEPHGRLIKAPDVSEYEVFDEDTGTREISLLALMECHRMVKEAKTIIDAEGE